MHLSNFGRGIQFLKIIFNEFMCVEGLLYLMNVRMISKNMIWIRFFNEN
jgi:hypothetical protein